MTCVPLPLTPFPVLALYTNVIFAFILISSNLSKMILGACQPFQRCIDDPIFPSMVASAKSQFGKKAEERDPAAVGWTEFKHR